MLSRGKTSVRHDVAYTTILSSLDGAPILVPSAPFPLSGTSVFTTELPTTNNIAAHMAHPPLSIAALCSLALATTDFPSFSPYSLSFPILLFVRQARW